MKNNEWLLENMRIQSTIFHIGKYCGSWRSGAAGSGKASYHIVMEGECWLHLNAAATATRLTTGDIVFILHDCPFVLAAHADKKEAWQAPLREMKPLSSQENGTALNCGFITFQSPLSQMVLSFLPDTIVFRKEDDVTGAVRKLLDIISQEARQESQASEKLISSLVAAAIFMVIRQYLVLHPISTPLDNFNAGAEFLNLMAEIVMFPARPWTVESMAQSLGMSRSWFIKRFNEASSVSPAEMVRQIRIAIASRYITQGVDLTESAERVGYQSQAAFNRIFKRITGMTPGHYGQQYRARQE